ncbi:MAG: hypothetical protein M1424_04920 [Candidatus Thermoplasmatota archaeon]|jgi:hypothetical protein|nr:hypothetical protein [Candidatus Thermoplasmatota archaeon]
MKSLDRQRGRKRIKIVTAIIAAAVIVVSGIFILQTHSGMNSPGVLIDRIVGNASNPQASHQFQGVNVSTNLWNLQSGQGNTTISIYSNSSMHIFSNYTDVITKSANVVGYPSARFRYGLPITVSDAIKESISSTVSYNLVNTSRNLPVDLSYDIMIQPSPTTFSPLVEIMIYVYYAPYYVNHLELGHFTSNIVANGTQKNITWNVEESRSATNGAPLITFLPEGSVFSPLNLSSFISETQSLLGLNLSNDYIQQINIGMEFGFSPSPIINSPYG